MNKRITKLCLFLVVSWLILPGLYAQITLSGYITDQSSGEALIGANLFVKNAKSGTATNAYGFYSLTLSVPDSVEVSFVGYEPKTLWVAQSETKDIGLVVSALPEVEITATKNRPVRENIGRVNMSVEQLKKAPVLLGEPDLLKSLALTPGISGGLEGTAGIFVRGGTPDQNLVLLDGATVYNTSHLFGFLSVFNTDAVKDIRLWKGNFPAQFGGRLSSIIDVSMREGNREKRQTEARVGLISSSIITEGPLGKEGKSSYMVAGRGAYMGLFVLPTYIAYKAKNSGQYVNYGMYDINAKFNHSFDNKGKLFFSLYHGKDHLPTREKHSTGAENRFDLKWGNTTFSTRYVQPLTNRLFLKASAHINHFQHEIGSDFQHEEEMLTQESENSSGILDIGGKLHLTWQSGKNNQLDAGSEWIYQHFTPGQVQRTTNGQIVTNISEPVNALSYALFVNDEIRLGEKWWLNGGLRMAGYQTGSRNYLFWEPRITLGVEVGKNSSFQISNVRMNQPIHLLTGNGGGLPTDVWVPATDRIEPQQGNQLSLGFSTDLFRSRWSLTLEGYYKEMFQLIEYRPGTNLLFNTNESWEDQVVSGGRGRAYGGEFLLRKNYGATTGWIGYTYAYNRRLFNGINGNDWYPAKYDRRHDLELVVSHNLNEKWTLSGNFVFSSGHTITLPTALLDVYEPFYAAKNNYRLPNYIRLDLNARYRFITKNGREAAWNFSVYNALARRNTSFAGYYPSGIYEWINEEDLLRGQVGFEGLLRQNTLFGFLPSVSYSIKF